MEMDICSPRQEVSLAVPPFIRTDNVAGAATVFISIGSYFIALDWPNTAKFLSSDERALLHQRLALDTPDSNMNHRDKKTTRRIFGDLMVWLGYVPLPPLQSLGC